MFAQEEPQPNQSQLNDLSALADGTLDPSRRASVEASIGANPQLRELYERERAVVERIQEVRAATQAPPALRARIAADRAPQRAWSGWRPGYAAALAGAVAALALVLGLTLPGGATEPSVSQAAALATRGPAQPAPGPNPQYPRSRLATDVQDVYFPNWSRSFGWHTLGQRVDQLGERQAVTVYYGRGGQQVAYTIVGAGPLPQPKGTLTVLNRYRLYTLTYANRTIVTWRRKGHTCVLSAAGVPATMLQHLAAWRPTVSA